MTPPTDERHTEARRIITRYEDQLRMSRASELASWGHLLEAEALLCPGKELPTSADELDILARIHVKQGQYDLARRRWEDAGKSGDRCAEFEEFIKILEAWLVFRHRMWIRRIKLATAVATLLLSIWILYLL